MKKHNRHDDDLEDDSPLYIAALIIGVTFAVLVAFAGSWVLEFAS